MLVFLFFIGWSFTDRVIASNSTSLRAIHSHGNSGSCHCDGTFWESAVPTTLQSPRSTRPVGYAGISLLVSFLGVTSGKNCSKRCRLTHNNRKRRSNLVIPLIGGFYLAFYCQPAQLSCSARFLPVCRSSIAPAYSVVRFIIAPKGG